MQNAKPSSNSAPFALGEIVVVDTLDHINAALTEHGIAAERVVNLLPIPAQPLAGGQARPGMRIIYRL